MIEQKIINKMAIETCVNKVLKVFHLILLMILAFNTTKCTFALWID